MKTTHKPYGDFATRLGTEELEPLTYIAIIAGATALITFILWAGIIADSIIGLIELA
jgi:hypothetical protein